MKRLRYWWARFWGLPKFRTVFHEDGKRTWLMCYEYCRDYAEILGGEVIFEEKMKTNENTIRCELPNRSRHSKLDVSSRDAG